MRHTSLQTYSKPFFLFNPADQKAKDFAELLQSCLESVEAGDKKPTIIVGGDGSLTYNFHNGLEGPSFAVKPPDSNSVLYRGHHNIEDGKTLERAFNEAKAYEITPLRVQINLSDNSSTIVLAYADVVIKSFNAQAVLAGIAMSNEQQQLPFMHGGIIIANPFGSTGITRRRGGHSISLGRDELVVTAVRVATDEEMQSDFIVSPGNVFSSDERFYSSIIPDNNEISIKITSPRQKRMTFVDFDGDTVLPDGQTLSSIDYKNEPMVINFHQRHITSIEVSVDRLQSRTLLLNPEFMTHPNP